MVKNIDIIIPKLAQFISRGTDAGNMILMLKNAGFEVTFESFTNSQRSKQDFIHELFINYSKQGNLKLFWKLADLLTVKEYFRPSEYDYIYDIGEAERLKTDLKACIRETKITKPITPKEFRKILFDIMKLHKGLEVVSKELFISEHYEQSVNEACKFLENYIQEKIGNKIQIGVDLMSFAFKAKDPILSLYPLPLDEKEQNEQQGFHLLTLGEVKYIKNRLSHRKTGSVIKTMSQALKILGFISFLLEEIDKMHIKEEEIIDVKDIPF